MQPVPASGDALRTFPTVGHGALGPEVLVPTKPSSMRSAVARSLLAGVLAAMAPAAADAALSVYHSKRDNGVPGAPAAIRGHGLVHVYFDNGATSPGAGLACTAAGADEICQAAVRFSTTGDLVIADVAWADPFVEDDEPLVPSMVRAGTGGDATLRPGGPDEDRQRRRHRHPG